MRVRKLFALLCSIAVTSNAMAGFNSTSVRLQGINPDLKGIVADEYTDAISVNTADLLNIAGYRLYTNLSNLYEGNIGADRAFNGTTTGGAGQNKFLLGGFGNPLINFLPNWQMGLFYDAQGGLTSKFNQLGELGESTLEKTTIYDSNNNGVLTDTGDSKLVVKENAKRQIDNSVSSLNALVAFPLNDSFKLGLNLAYSNTANAYGNAGIVSSSEEVIDASYERWSLTYPTSNTAVTQKQNQVARETYTNKTLNINFAGRWQVSETIDLGATFGISPTSIKQERTSVVTMIIDNTVTAGNPITADANMTNGSMETLSAAGYAPFSGTVNIPGGFAWSYNAAGTRAMGPNGELNIEGYTQGDEVGKYESRGTAINVSADSHYQATENLKFVGRINVNVLPGTLEGSLSRSNTYNTIGAGPDGILGTIDDVAGSKKSVSENTNYTISSGKWDNKSVGLTAGGEAKLQKNVLFGFGVNYTMGTLETSFDWARTENKNNTYDQLNNGFENVAGINDKRNTSDKNDNGKSQNKIETDTFQIPLGFELRPWPRFPIRLGVTHKITKTKRTSITEVLKEGQTSTRTESNGAITTTYSTTEKSSYDKNVITTTARATQYYYGIGYEWSENLVFDILGVASGNDVLDLKEWRIGATLKF